MIYYAYLSNKIQEGGMARNKAFYDYFLNKATVINQFSKFKLSRIFKTFRTLVHWLFLKNQKILIHQGTFLYMFPELILRFSFFKIFFFKVLSNLAKKNFVYLEINDLRYEQAYDLELDTNKQLLLNIQLAFFAIDELHYIFASEGLMDYAVKHYQVKAELCQVAVNGGLPLNSESDDKEWTTGRIKFVYAGSLNKGRQIELLIDKFRDSLNCDLVLMGDGGDWIDPYIKNMDNIKYLGNFEEHEAQKLVARCDIGIIPYDPGRLYYNICYPTKASFYITSGLGILSTPLKTLENMFSGNEFIEFKGYEEWGTFLKSINNHHISVMKKSANNYKEKLFWDNILRQIKF